MQYGVGAGVETAADFISSTSPRHDTHIKGRSGKTTQTIDNTLADYSWWQMLAKLQDMVPSTSAKGYARFPAASLKHIEELA